MKPIPVDRVIIKYPGYEENNDSTPGIMELMAWGYILAPLFWPVELSPACNEYNGYISRGKDGMNRISAPNDYLVSPGESYFHVSDVLR